MVTIPFGYSESVALTARAWQRMSAEQRARFHDDYLEFVVIMGIKELLIGHVPFELYLGGDNGGDAIWQIPPRRGGSTLIGAW